MKLCTENNVGLNVITTGDNTYLAYIFIQISEFRYDSSGDNAGLPCEKRNNQDSANVSVKKKRGRYLNFNNYKLKIVDENIVSFKDILLSYGKPSAVIKFKPKNDGETDLYVYDKKSVLVHQRKLTVRNNAVHLEGETTYDLLIKNRNGNSK